MSKNTITSICAFDIGIKNLSYCILSKNNNENKIINWELIDLRDEHPTCIGKLKGGKQCSKPAKLCHQHNPTIFYCDKHCKQYDPKQITISHCDKNKPCEFVKDDNKCTKTGNNIVDSKIYCDKHLKNITSSYEKSNKLCNMKIIGCMKEPLYDIGTNMYNALDKRPEIMNVDKIVIENQPSLTNPTMKSISILLLSYFIMKKHPKVEFIAPSGKLKINEILTKSILSKCTKSNKYKITKELGVKYCDELLDRFSDSNNWKSLITNSKKKDDLCDSFLHAYYHMYGKGLNSKEFIDCTSQYFLKKTETKTQKDNSIKIDI